MPCQLNGNHHARFLVDTGAVVTTLSRQIANEMGLDLAHPIRWIRIASVHRTTQVPIVRLETLQVGGRRVSDVEAAVMSFPSGLRVDGLLGVNFLRKFRVTFEFERATLILR